MKIEQPTRITDDGHLFFLRGYSGGYAAEYGIRLTREEYEASLLACFGKGTLVERGGVFSFEQEEGEAGLARTGKENGI